MALSIWLLLKVTRMASKSSLRLVSHVGGQM